MVGRAAFLSAGAGGVVILLSIDVGGFRSWLCSRLAALSRSLGRLLSPRGSLCPRPPGSCMLRIIHVNDVYELTNLPRAASLVRDWSAGSRGGKPDKVLVTMGGDFLAPSMLSGLDNGKGMMECLNALGTTHVCFGNHECDVPHEALVKRIAEFRGVWLNSNMPAITERPLPEYDIVEVQSGSHSRRVALLGLLCDYTHLYRPTSFNGLPKKGGIEPPLQAARRICEQLNSSRKPDAIVAMTHLDQPDDEAFAREGASWGLTAVLGGHDHGVCNQQIGTVPIAKAGMDAAQAVVLDLVWESQQSVAPTRHVTVEEVSAYPEDPALAKLVRRCMLKVEALESMVLASVPQICSDIFPGLNCKRPEAMLSSIGVRKGESSVASMLASVVRLELGADAALIEGGSVRGSAEYTKHFSFANLRGEMPFENLYAVAQVPGKDLSDFVKDSRDKVAGSGDRGYPFFLHCDCGLKVDPKSNEVLKVAGLPLDPAKVYSVAVPLDLDFGSGKNEAMIAFAKANPKSVPHKDAAVPAKRLVVKFFGALLWKRLPAFKDIDVDGSNTLSYEEVHNAYTKALADTNQDGVIDDAEKAAAGEMVEILIKVLDKDENGVIDRDEYDELFVHPDGLKPDAVIELSRCRSFQT